jgi:GTP pyrophosphokinase
VTDADPVEIYTEADAPAEVDASTAPLGPRREWLEFVKTQHAQLQIGRWFADRNEPGMTIPDKVRLGRASIGLALRQVHRGLANDVPLRRLADEMGYPDLEALLVAVVDRKVSPDFVVERLIALVDHEPG